MKKGIDFVLDFSFLNYPFSSTQFSRTFLAFAISMLAITVGIAQKTLKPGENFRDCPDCPEMIIIPGGNFIMGSPADEPGRFDTEGPQRSITVSSFAAGKFDITRGEWAAFVSATNRPIANGCAWSELPDEKLKQWDQNPQAAWNHLGFPQDDHHPAVCISWNDAEDYAQWLSQHTGHKYRLLTEAEWEYAARAGTSTAFPWGSTITHENANYGADSLSYSGLASGRDQWVKTSPVGSFPANSFGLHDMVGNVLQWVQDCFANDYTNLPTDGSAFNKDVPLQMTGRMSWMNGKNSCSFRVLRGGDWGDPPRMIRSAFRNLAPAPGTTLATYRSAGVGFRVAMTLK